VAEPLASGFVSSLSRPGGNTTGFTNVEPSIAGKWVELVKEIAPPVARVGLIYNPKTAPYAGPFLETAHKAAARLGIQSVAVPIHDEAEIRTALTAMADKATGLVSITDSFIVEHRSTIIGLAGQRFLPAVYPFRLFATEGGLMSYGADILEMYQGAASYLDRILKGEPPGDLPVQQPTKFEFVLNIRTANALGLTVPLLFQQLADDVID